MGVYWFAYVYYGRLLSREARDRLTEGDLKDAELEVTPLSPDRYVLHAPGGMIPISSADPVLSREDVANGPPWDAVAKFLHGRPILRGDEEKMKSLIRKASDGASDAAGLYVVQGRTSTLDPNDRWVHIEYNLRVV